MDQTRFDALTKSLTAGHSRRGITRLLGGLALSSPLVSWLGVAESEAKKKTKKKKKKKKKKNQLKQCHDFAGYERCGIGCCDWITGQQCCGDTLCCDVGWKCACNGTACIPANTSCCRQDGYYFLCPSGYACGSEMCPGASAP